MAKGMSLFNTLTRSVESLRPADDSRTLHIYSCGPTVYRYVHIGNLRTFLLSDLVVRAARYAGFDVYHVMNITDVGHLADEVFERGEDKILLAADSEGKSPAEIAHFYEAAFFEDIAAIGITKADLYPKASEHIPQMIQVIQKLLDRGHAYLSGGNVYFDVTTLPEYGKLSGNTLDALRAGHRGHSYDPNKRHPEDFLLWRKATPRRLVKFDSPWGEGFPGWHIECSAMSLHHLGERIDIHAGGQDLIFPHHEDEIAQTVGVTGKHVVKTWVHGAHLLMGGHKMTKSKFNDLRAVQICERGIDPLAFRYLCLTARYRKQLNFSWDALGAAARALTRLRDRFEEAASETSLNQESIDTCELSPMAVEYEARFTEAVWDDLDTPRALEIVHRMLEDANLDRSEKVSLALRWDRALGIGLVPFAREKFQAAGEGHRQDITDSEIRSLISQRQAARERRDFQTADRIRNELESHGIQLTDTPKGTVWKTKKKL
ncbi:MAG: cysteine--tRNA ligase [Acidimicrobiia bacterium]